MKNRNQHPEPRRSEPTLIVSTETWGGRVARWVMHASATVFAVCGAAWLLHTGRVADLTPRWLVWPLATIVTLSAMVFVISPVIDRSLTRGVWRFTSTGATFRPLHGPVRTVAWRDVTDVHAHGSAIRLKTSDQTLRVRGSLIDASSWREIGARMREHLSDRAALSALQGLDGSPRLRGAAVLVSFALTTLLATWFVVRSDAVWPLVVLAGAIAVRVLARLTARFAAFRADETDDADADDATPSGPLGRLEIESTDGPGRGDPSGGLAA